MHLGGGGRRKLIFKLTCDAEFYQLRAALHFRQLCSTAQFSDSVLWDLPWKKCRNYIWEYYKISIIIMIEQVCQSMFESDLTPSSSMWIIPGSFSSRCCRIVPEPAGKLSSTGGHRLVPTSYASLTSTRTFIKGVNAFWSWWNGEPPHAVRHTTTTFNYMVWCGVGKHALRSICRLWKV